MFDRDSTLTLMQLAFPVGCKVRTVYWRAIKPGQDGTVNKVYLGLSTERGHRVWIDVKHGNTICSYEPDELVLDED